MMRALNPNNWFFLITARHCICSNWHYQCNSISIFGFGSKNRSQTRPNWWYQYKNQCPRQAYWKFICKCFCIIKFYWSHRGKKKYSTRPYDKIKFCKILQGHMICTYNIKGDLELVQKALWIAYLEVKISNISLSKITVRNGTPCNFTCPTPR